MGRILGISVLTVVGLGLVLWGLGWAFTPMDVTSASNVRSQFGFAYTLSESLKASARQACTMEKMVKGATSDEERVQRQSQLAAIEMNYERIARDYNARMQNAFEAKYVAPRDVPRSAPSLAEMKRQACD